MFFFIPVFSRNPAKLDNTKFRQNDLKQGIEPTAVIKSIANLPDWWMEQ